MPVKNERKVCDAMARLLETRTGLVRTNARCPEKDHSGPPVDFKFDLGEQSYAIEHTQVEAFEQQIRGDIDFSVLVRPIKEALSEQLPIPGLYYLTFPIDPCANLKRKDLPNAQEAIINWVKTTARELHAEAPTRQDKAHKPQGHRSVRKAMLEVVPFELTLGRVVHWAQTKGDGTLSVQRWAPPDVEGLRRLRIKRALGDKLPKLAESKALFGDVSILVLENDDIALTHYGLVAEAIEAEIANYEHAPDEIFFVDTTFEAQWTVWSLRRGEIQFPEMEIKDRVGYHEFDPTQLDDV